MMTVMVVRGVTLDGASLGIEYYLTPDFNRLSDSIVSFKIQYFLGCYIFLLEIRDKMCEIYTEQVFGLNNLRDIHFKS